MQAGDRQHRVAPVLARRSIAMVHWWRIHGARIARETIVTVPARSIKMKDTGHAAAGHADPGDLAGNIELLDVRLRYVPQRPRPVPSSRFWVLPWVLPGGQVLEVDATGGAAVARRRPRDRNGRVTTPASAGED